jgi:hypothetical protein
MGWVRYDGQVGNLATAVGEYCAAYAAAAAGQGTTYTCNPNYSISMLGLVTRWTPVPNLTFSAEAIWTHLNTAMSGFTTAAAPGSPLPTNAYDFKNQDTVSFNVRAQRNF